MAIQSKQSKQSSIQSRELLLGKHNIVELTKNFSKGKKVMIIPGTGPNKSIMPLDYVTPGDFYGNYREGHNYIWLQYWAVILPAEASEANSAVRGFFEISELKTHVWSNISIGVDGFVLKPNGDFLLFSKNETFLESSLLKKRSFLIPSSLLYSDEFNEEYFENILKETSEAVELPNLEDKKRKKRK